MRKAQSLLFCTLAAALAGLTLPAQAAKQTQRPAVFDPAAPTAALQHTSLPRSGRIVDQPGDWKAANAAVAEFPRGHGDVLKWEKTQSAPPASTPGKATEPDAMPAHGHHQHGGQP